MGLGKKEGIFLAAVLIVLLGASIIYLGEFGISGHITWESGTEFTNCNEAEVEAFWNEIFVEPFDSGAANIYFGDQNIQSCEFYVDKLEGNIYQRINFEKKEGLFLTETDENGDDWNVNSKYNYSAVWMNLSQAGIDKVNSISSYSGGKTLTFNNDDTQNWSDPVETNSEARSRFSEKMKVDIGDLEELVITIPIMWLFVEEESFPESKTLIQSIFHNESSVLFGAYGMNGTPSNSYQVSLPYINFLDNIDNESIEVNSSWEDHVDLDEYFNVSGLVDYSCEFLDSANAGGKNINWSLGVGNMLRFRPTENFVGEGLFRVKAQNSSQGLVNYSNNFTIKVVTSINHAPKRTNLFGELFLAQGQTWVLEMENYFDDEDNDNLKYEIEEGQNLTFTWNGSKLIVGTTVNFTGFSKFIIVASDAEKEVRSNEIYVFEGNNITFEENGSILLGTNSSMQNSSSGPANDSANSNSTGTSEDSPSNEKIKWILIIGAGILLLAGILILIWLFVLKKSPKVPDEPQDYSQMSNYMQQLAGNQAVQTPQQTQNVVQTPSNNEVVASAPVQQTDKQTVAQPNVQQTPQKTVQEMQVPKKEDQNPAA